MCLDNLKDLQIESSFEDIEKMSCTQFKNLLKEKVKSAAFIYLIEKQLSKGGEIEYTELKMSDYLLPNNELSIEEKIQVFSIRNKMDKNIPAELQSLLGSSRGLAGLRLWLGPGNRPQNKCVD